MPTAGVVLPGEGDARESVERRFARELARLDATLELAIKVLERNDSVFIRRGRRISPKSVPLVLGLFGKAVKTTRAIRICVSPALGEDCLVLCRTLLETAVAILYLLQKHTPLRTEEYLAHVLKRTEKVMAKWKDTPGLKRWGKRVDRQTQLHLAQYAYLGAQRLKQLRMWYSGDATIEETFKRVGLAKTYQSFYSYAAGIQHVSDITSHVELGGKGAVVLAMGSSDEGSIRMMLDMANRAMWTVTRRVAYRLRLGYEADIERHRPPRDRSQAPIRAWAKRQKERENKLKNGDR